MARHFPVVGYDVDSCRVAELADGFDRTGEVTREEFDSATLLSYAADPAGLADCNI